VHEFNARIREAADRHGVRVVHTPAAFDTDPRMWCADRLHLSPLGHTLAAAQMARAFGLPDPDNGRVAVLPALPPPTRWHATRTELTWLATFVGPWLYRRVRGRSSGDGRTAKRPHLTPVVT
jgi:hypothetical protein